MPGRAERGNQVGSLGICHAGVRGAVRENAGQVGEAALGVAEERRPRRRVVARYPPTRWRLDECVGDLAVSVADFVQQERHVGYPRVAAQRSAAKRLDHPHEDEVAVDLRLEGLG